MLIIKWKTDAARIPALCVLFATLLAGGALVRLSAREAVASEQATARQFAADTVREIERTFDAERSAAGCSFDATPTVHAWIERFEGTRFDVEVSCATDAHSRPRVMARSGRPALEHPIVLDGGNWSVAVAPSNGWMPWSALISRVLLVIVVAIFATLITAELARRPAALRRDVAERDRRLRDMHQRLGVEIQSREALEAQLTHANLHDPVTGLLNRRYFFERVARALSQLRHTADETVAVAAITFDQLDALRDSLDTAAFDELLLETVRRCKTTMASRPCVISRLGENQIGVLLTGMPSEAFAVDLVDAIRQNLARPFNVRGGNLFARVRVGLAFGASGYERADELVYGAQLVGSRAAVDDDGGVAIFGPAIGDLMAARNRMEDDLRLAIARNELRLQFQPIVALYSGQLAGFEALVSWHHPIQGSIAPAHFIALAEERGLIADLNRWVLRETCRHTRAWHDRLLRPTNFYVSVNLPAYDLRHPNLVDSIGAAMRDFGVPPAVLRLELTESMMIDNAGAVSDVVAALRELQVSLILDDFGTGYSSLNYLSRSQFDCLKIDRSLIARLEHRDQRAMAQGIVSLARDLGIQTIAEGVGSAEHHALLASWGCDYGQGRHFAPPLDDERARALLLSGEMYPSRFLPRPILTQSAGSARIH